MDGPILAAMPEWFSIEVVDGPFAATSWMTGYGDAPSRDEIEARLGHDSDLIDVVFHASIAEVVEAHVGDERLRTALHGQGIIGTWAGPRDPGTAVIHALHSMGSLEGRGGAWGYVEGGMGRVSFALCDAATDAGAVVATGVPVAGIVPGEGVRLEGGETVAAAVVVSNADPVRTVALCEGGVPDAFAARVARWRIRSPVAKRNAALTRLPCFTAAAEGDPTPYRAMVTISDGVDVTQAAFEACRDGGAAQPAWCEVYFQTAYDPTVAPPGGHTMSVFAQYVPYGSPVGITGDAIVTAVARFAPDVADCMEYREVLTPDVIEDRVGLTGGHIFQGDCLPEQMWDRRFAPRTPIEGLYLCGAAAHPGGSVIAANGRNAAVALLADRAEPPGRDRSWV